MRKKIIITINLIIIIIQAIMPIKVNGFKEQSEIISEQAQIEKYQTGEVASEESGLGDLATGLFLEPTVELVTVVVDALMQIFTSFMTQSDYEFVMLPYEELPEEMKGTNEQVETETEIHTEEGTTVKITISEEEMNRYQKFWGAFRLKYPNFSYSPEEIFAGKIDLLDINFMQETNEDDNWNKIRDIVSTWYKILRMVAILGLLSVLIYTGIKIIIESSAKNKAKYKEMIVNWFMAAVLLFSMQYIMSFILNIIEEILVLFKGIAGKIEVHAGDTVFKTNLIGFARFQMQKQNFSTKVGHLIIYVALVTYTFKFTFLYLKRVLTTAVLTLISPIIAIMYPIDKMNGKANGFQSWLKDYTYNALLQPMHYILYYILVTSSLTLAVRNPLYGIAALMFISNAERLLKKIFGFEKASSDAVSGVAGAFATGAVTSMLMNVARDPLHPFKGGKGSGGKSGRSGLGGNSYFDDNPELNNVNEDTIGTDNLLNLLYGSTPDRDNPDRDNSDRDNPDRDTPDRRGSDEDIPTDDSSEQPLPRDSGDSAQPIPGIDDFFLRYRQGLPLSIAELGGLSFDDYPSYSMEDLLNLHGQAVRNGGSFEDYTAPIFEQIPDLNQQMLEDILLGRIDYNESGFDAIEATGRVPQYADGDPTKTSDLMKQVIELNKKANDIFLPSNERRRYRKQAEKLLKQINRRMAQNQYIQRHGGPMSIWQNEQNRLNILKNTATGEHIPNEVINPIEVINQDDVSNQNGEQRERTGRNNNQEEPSERREEQGETHQENDLQRDSSQRDNPQRDNSRRDNQQRDDSRRENPQRNRTRRNRQEEVNAWKEFKKKHPHVRGATAVGKTLIKPIYDSERDDNARRLAGKVFKGAIGLGVGITAAAVQAGISITDGKYKVGEGIATVGAGIVSTSRLGDGKLARTYKEALHEGEEGIQTEEYGRQWFNRDDVIHTYRNEFQDEGKAMRRRAVNNYITRGITDCEDQIKAMKYANQLKTERGLGEEDADKLAIATLQYKQSLNRYSNYAVLFDKDKRKKYIEAQANAYQGSKSRDTIIRLHEDLIQNVLDFDKANR